MTNIKYSHIRNNFEKTLMPPLLLTCFNNYKIDKKLNLNVITILCEKNSEMYLFVIIVLVDDAYDSYLDIVCECIFI